MSRRSVKWWLLLIGLFGLPGLVVLIGVSLRSADRAEAAKASMAHLPSNRPVKKLAPGYVSSDACLACHQHEHNTWHASFHRTMTQVPTPDNVLADFNDVSLTSLGRTYRLTREDDQFYVELDDPEWPDEPSPPPRVMRQIVLMTGSHHEQDFWFETIAYGRLISRLPFVYRIEEQRWIQDHSVLLQPPESTVGFDEWNHSCIRCHATMGRPRLAPDVSPPEPHGPHDSHVVEFGIACEACHGPGETHVLRHATLGGQLDRLPDHLRPPAFNIDAPIGPDQIVSPAKLDAHQASQICGQCHAFFTMGSQENHAHWARDGFQFRPGNDLEDRMMIRSQPLLEKSIEEQPPAIQWWLRNQPHYIEERFWSDGVVRILGREYTAMLESPCFQGGELSCLSCHSMHPSSDDPRPLKEWANDQLAAGMETNQACLQCHAEKGDELTAHTHHAADSPGSRCYNCHMPPTAYGLLKATHSHTVESPSVANSLMTGRPNGCNLCHLDRSWEWTANHLQEWFGTEQVEMTGVQAGVPASAILAMSGEAGQRALIAWAMGWPAAQEASGTDWQARFLAQLLDDPYEAVRFIAHRSLRTLEGFDSFDYDFLSGADVRTEARDRALTQWREQREANGRSVDLREFIHASDGDLPSDIFDWLLERRDNRRVLLME